MGVPFPSPEVEGAPPVEYPTGTVSWALRRSNPQLQSTVVSKTSMLEASRIVEAMAQDDGDDVVLLAGFQFERFWRMEQRRYDRMTATTVALAIEAAGDGGDGSFVAVPIDHPIANEWFVVALGPSVSVTLCGLDLGRATGGGPLHATRAFDTIFSTDPKLAHEAFQHVAQDPRLAFPDVTRRQLAARIGARGWEPRRSRGRGPTESVLRAVLRRAEVHARERTRRADEDDLQALAVRKHERQRLVGLVHDGALQRLLVAAQDLAEFRRTGEADRLDLVDDARDALRDGVAALRRDLRSAYDATPTTDGLRDRLDALALYHATRAGFDVDVDVEPRLLVDDDDVVACVRELLTNAAKHSGADRVRVRVRHDDEHGAVVIEVCDDGVGMDPDVPGRALARGHLGLALVRERVRAAGGAWMLCTSPGAGVQARVRLPVTD
ncbi:unannotated protein [freshwater metagenome]|uniref:Unannotated protein n=1 Tax=freshwater metagenome TaxID=449393 RepID=A0A6J7J2G8_9ZZZZ